MSVFETGLSLAGYWGGQSVVKRFGRLGAWTVGQLDSCGPFHHPTAFGRQIERGYRDLPAILKIPAIGGGLLASLIFGVGVEEY